MSRTVDPTEIRDTTDRLAHLLSSLDLGSCVPSTLAELVTLGERIERLGHGLKTRAAARVAGSAVWQGDGDRTAADWLARQTGTSKADAGRLVETGRQLEALPAVAGAVTRGELSARQAEAIAGAAAADPGASGGCCPRRRTGRCGSSRTSAAAPGSTPSPTPRPPTGGPMPSGPAGPGPTPTASPGTSSSRGPWRRWRGSTTPSATAPTSLFRQARAEGRREPSEAYAYDAATQLLTSAGDGEPVPAGADAKIIVRIDHTALRRGHATEGETCEIAGIGPIPVATVREWMGDAFLAAVLTKGDDVQRVVHLGRKFKATQRTALQWQNPVCARKGCANRLGLEYDHFEDWATTHTTRVEAAKRFCHPCHQLKSRGWRVSEPDAQRRVHLHPTRPQRPRRRRRHRRTSPTPPNPNHRTRSPTPRHRVAAHARTVIGTVPVDGDLRGVGGARG